MDIKERIQVVIDSHKLSAGEFALKIGVQRSSVSHVLSGRNKPGFDFLEKIILSFPRVDAEWLLTGKKSQKQNSSHVVDQSVKSDVKAMNSTKKVVKIAFFYEDSSFEMFQPSEK